MSSFIMQESSFVMQDLYKSVIEQYNKYYKPDIEKNIRYSNGDVGCEYHMYYGPNKSLVIDNASDLFSGSIAFLNLPPDVHEAYIEVVEEKRVSHSLNDIKNIIFNCKKCFSGSIYPLLVSQSTMRYLLNQKMDDALRQSIYALPEGPFDEPFDEPLDEPFDELLDEPLKPLDDFFLNIIY